MPLLQLLTRELKGIAVCVELAGTELGGIELTTTWGPETSLVIVQHGVLKLLESCCSLLQAIHG